MGSELTHPGDLEQASLESSAPETDKILEPEGKSFGIRAVSYVIDVIVIYASNYIVAFPMGILVGILYLAMGRDLVIYEQSNQCLDLAVGLVLTLVYFVAFEGLYGATPGKLITGMRVVKEDGRPCSLGAALHRGLWRYVDAIIFGAIAYSNMTPPLQQRLGDKKAHTLVVGKNEPFIQESRPWPWFVVALLAYLLIRAAGVVVVLFALIS